MTLETVLFDALDNIDIRYPSYHKKTNMNLLDRDRRLGFGLAKTFPADNLITLMDKKTSQKKCNFHRIDHQFILTLIQIIKH